MENYAAVKHDRVKTDELIREQMRSGNGDYECILNVLAALKQEDPELYDMCLNYPNRKVKETSLQEQGFCIADYEDVSEVDLEDSEYSAEEVEQMKVDGEPLEIHTNETIERFNEESEERLMRLYHDEEEDVYKPIVRITDASEAGASEAGASDADTDESVSEAGSSEGSETGADDRQIIQPPVKPKNSVSMSFHQNADVQMLWGVKGELDFSKKFCTAVIECEVTRIDQMELAIGIVERAKAREANGGNLLPRDLSRIIERSETEKQEYSDNLKLKRWKKKDISNKIIEYLNENLQGWNYVRNSFDDAKYNAKLIVERARMRELNGQNLLPKFYRGDKYTNEQHLECKDAMRLSNWFSGLNNNKVAIFIKIYLDEFLPEWNDDLDAIAMKEAINIVERAKERKIKELNFLPCYRPRNKYPNLTEEQIQENKDKAKIGSWNDVIRGTGQGRCSEDIHKYLNKHLPGWRETLDDKCIKEVNDLIKRAKIRETNGGDLLPKQFHHIPKKERTMTQIIEYKDASKLKQLKKAVSGIRGTCPDEVKKSLDKELPGWNETLDEIALKCAKSIIERANLRKLKGTNLLPMARSPVKNESEKQELVDDAKLRNWKSALEGSKNSVCSDEVCKALDDNLPGWKDKKTNPLKTAQEIVEFASLHKCIPSLKRKPKGDDTRTIEEKLENSYANKLADWRKALNGKRGTCSDDVRDYLDKELPGWRPTEITTPPAPAPLPPPPPAPPVKRKLKLKVKVPSEPKSTQPKKQSAIPIASEHSEAEKYPHHFPPPSEIGLLHKTYLKMRSDTLHQKFKSDPQLWREYHATRKRTFASYDPASIPSNQIIQELEQIQTKRRKVVIDMGCGEAPIAHHFLAKNDQRFTFKNYDHQSGGDPLIQAVDISAVPLDDASVEIGIMALALWGTSADCKQYINEAYRVLESGGKFYISDSTKKWSPEPLTPENGGALLRTLLTDQGFTIIREAVGSPFCLFVCTKNY